MKISNFGSKIITFLKEVRLEIKKVNWPTKQTTLRYTLIVIGVSLGLAALLGVMDTAFSFLLRKFILK